MEEFQQISTGWSWEQNKMFELALAVVDEESPNRWESIAAMVVGKSAEEVEEHYLILLEDLQIIESGEVPTPDYRVPAGVERGFGELHLHLPVDSVGSTCWTDEEQKCCSFG